MESAASTFSVGFYDRFQTLLSAQCHRIHREMPVLFGSRPDAGSFPT